MKKNLLFALTLVLLTACSFHSFPKIIVQETPGSIEKIPIQIDFNLIQLADWDFDPNHILLLQGWQDEATRVPSDILLLDRHTGEIVRYDLNWYGVWYAAQGPGGKVVIDNGMYELFLLDLETSRVTSIAKTGSGPDFSPDGSQISYWNEPDLMIFDTKTNQVRKLATIDVNKFSDNPLIGKFTWHPEGISIGFLVDYRGYSGIPDKKATEIWVLNLLDMSLEKLYGVVDSIIVDMDWSPDGKSMVILEKEYSNEIVSVYLIMLQENGVCIIEGLNYKIAPNMGVDWSPDGEWIALNVGFTEGLYLINVEKVFGAPYDQLNCPAH